MKTLKILVAIFILVLGTALRATSQPARSEIRSNLSFILPCNSDLIINTVTGEKTVWNEKKGDSPDIKKIQIKYDNAALPGRRLNNLYLFSLFTNEKLQSGEVSSLNMATLKLNGKIFAEIPVMVHITPDGEVSLEVIQNGIVCR